LCYASLVEGDGARAVADCRAAVDADPALTTARNNLALAYAVAGDFDAASGEFGTSGDAVAERFNMGGALFATGHYEEAAQAFDAAAAMRPSLKVARMRAQQARAMLAAVESGAARGTTPHTP